MDSRDFLHGLGIVTGALALLALVVLLGVLLVTEGPAEVTTLAVLGYYVAIVPAAVALLEGTLLVRVVGTPSGGGPVRWLYALGAAGGLLSMIVLHAQLLATAPVLGEVLGPVLDFGGLSSEGILYPAVLGLAGAILGATVDLFGALRASWV